MNKVNPADCNLLLLNLKTYIWTLHYTYEFPGYIVNVLKTASRGLSHSFLRQIPTLWPLKAQTSIWSWYSPFLVYPPIVIKIPFCSE